MARMHAPSRAVPFAVFFVVFTVIVVLVVLHPASRMVDARNVARLRDVQTLADALAADRQDRGGAYLAALAALAVGAPAMIGTEISGCHLACDAVATASSCVNVDALVVSGALSAIPTDPRSGSPAMTGYYVVRTATGVTVGACNAEEGRTIAVSR